MMQRLLQILITSLIGLIFISCSDNGPGEETVPLKFTTASSAEMNQTIQETPKEFTWDKFNNNVQMSMNTDAQWSGEIVLSGFQVQNGEVVNRVITDPIETSVDQLSEGVSTKEMFPGFRLIPGSPWLFEALNKPTF